MRKLLMPQSTIVLAALFAASLSVTASEPYRPAEIEKKLQADYAVTVVNAEGGIVTQGAVLVLKRGLTAGAQSACTSEYKDGNLKLTKSGGANCAGEKIGRVFGRFAGIPGVSAPAPSGVQGTRAFVMGEKMYVTKIEVKDAIAFSLLSDPINDVTYRAEIHFATPKGTAITVDQAEKLVAEMFTIAPPADNAQGGGQQDQAPAAGAQPAAEQPAAAPAPIAPPPPPPDESSLAPIAPPAPPPDGASAPPATVSLGMSVDQVVAILGQPLRMAKVGSKQIYSYQSLKITFVNGKVTDVQ